MIHVFTNLDEVVEISGKADGAKTLAFDFYGPRVLDFFNRTAGILTLVSSVFAIAMMQRRRESTATEAAGITKWRIARPLIFASVTILALAAVSRELYIPKYKAMLVRSLTNWTENGSVPMHQVKDLETGILIKGNQLKLQDSQVTEIELTLPKSLNSEFMDVSADTATILPANKQLDRPKGVLVGLNVEPKKILDSPSIFADGQQPIVYTPQDYPWLRPTEIFVACDLDVEEIAYGDNLSQYSSLSEMIESQKRPSNRFGLGNQVSIHSRVLKPVLEMSLLLIGLPIVICDPNRNIFLGAAVCMMIIFAIESFTMASHTLGAYRMIRPAAMAAWLPVFVFLPFTAFSIRKLFS